MAAKHAAVTRGRCTLLSALTFELVSMSMVRALLTLECVLLRCACCAHLFSASRCLPPSMQGWPGKVFLACPSKWVGDPQKGGVKAKLQTTLQNCVSCPVDAYKLEQAETKHPELREQTQQDQLQNTPKHAARQHMQNNQSNQNYQHDHSSHYCTNVEASTAHATRT